MILDQPKHNDTVIGSDFDVCELCASKKAHDEHIMRTKAKRELAGSFVGKSFLKVGDVLICEDCLSKAMAEIALKKKAVKRHKTDIGDVEEAEKEEAVENTEEEAPKKRGRKPREDKI